MVFLLYQLDLVMPGIRPLWAISRMQMRHSPHRRNTPRALPQTLQRVYPRTANFGFRLAFTINDVLAKLFPPVGAAVFARLVTRRFPIDDFRFPIWWALQQSCGHYNAF